MKKIAILIGLIVIIFGFLGLCKVDNGDNKKPKSILQKVIIPEVEASSIQPQKRTKSNNLSRYYDRELPEFVGIVVKEYKLSKRLDLEKDSDKTDRPPKNDSYEESNLLLDPSI